MQADQICAELYSQHVDEPIDHYSARLRSEFCHDLKVPHRPHSKLSDAPTFAVSSTLVTALLSLCMQRSTMSCCAQSG